ncbi:hypothetical protein Tco_0533644 [Tanacetum coccineum]
MVAELLASGVLRGFLGLTGYYRRFIKDYARIIQPLTALLKKNAFSWNPKAQVAFEQLQQAMILAAEGHLIAFLRTDHFSLKYVLDQRITTPFQSKWLPKLWGFDYEIEYKQGLQDGSMTTLKYTCQGDQLKRKVKWVVGLDDQLRKKMVLHFHTSSVGECDVQGLFVVEPLKLLERKIMKQQNRMGVFGLIQWTNSFAEDATWEDLADLTKRFPLFVLDH